MSDKVYRIKPLVWEAWSEKHCVAMSIFGDLRLTYYSGDGWWALHVHGAYVRPMADTLEAAQLAAEQWYRERMAAGLVEIQT